MEAANEVTGKGHRERLFMSNWFGIHPGGKSVIEIFRTELRMDCGLSCKMN